MDTRTPSEKAIITRRNNIAARAAKEKKRNETIEALESILRDNQSSRKARENALELLTMVYRR